MSPEFSPQCTTLFLDDSLLIVIEDNVWLGGGAILLPGVTIGRMPWWAQVYLNPFPKELMLRNHT